MPPDGGPHLPGVCAPQLDQPVLSTGRQRLPIRRKRRAVDLPLVSPKRPRIAAVREPVEIMPLEAALLVSVVKGRLMPLQSLQHLPYVAVLPGDLVRHPQVGGIQVLLDA